MSVTNSLFLPNFHIRTVYSRVPLIRHSDSLALEDDSLTFDPWLCGLYSAHQVIILASEGSKDE